MSREGSVKTIVPGQNEAEISNPLSPPSRLDSAEANKKGSTQTHEILQSPMTQAPHDRPHQPNFESNENFDNSQPQIEDDEEGSSPALHDRPQSMAQYRPGVASTDPRMRGIVSGFNQQQEGANQVSMALITPDESSPQNIDNTRSQKLPPLSRLEKPRMGPNTSELLRNNQKRLLEVEFIDSPRGRFEPEDQLDDF